MMKTIGAVLLCLSMQACGQQYITEHSRIPDDIEGTGPQPVVAISTSTVTICCDSLAYYRRRVDTLNHKNFLLAAQVDWVQYYLALMQRRSKDTIYSKGWLIRAVGSKLPANPYIKAPKQRK